MTIRIGAQTFELHELKDHLKKTDGEFLGRKVSINNEEFHPLEIIDAVHQLTTSKSILTKEDHHCLQQIVEHLSFETDEPTSKKIHQIRSIIYDSQAEKGKLVGSGMVMELKSGNLVPIEIRETVHGFRREFTAYHKGEVVGSIGVYKFVKTGDHYGADSDRTSTPYALYGSSIPDHSIKIMVQDLKAPGNRQFKGIGTELMQLAYELSKIEGGHGKLVFDASYESGAFYHKLGFRSLHYNPDRAGGIDAAMAECVEKGEKWSGSANMYLPRSKMEFWEAKVQSKPVLFAHHDKMNQNKFSTISEVIQHYDVSSDYFDELKAMMQTSPEDEIRNGLNEALIKAHEGNGASLCALLQLIPQKMLISFVFENFPGSKGINNLFVQLIHERITDRHIPEMIFQSPLPEGEKKEFFKTYLENTYSLDRSKVDKDGNNLFHYFCRTFTEPFKGRQPLAIKCLTLENYNAKNHRGETPGDLASGSLAKLVKQIEEDPSNYI